MKAPLMSIPLGDAVPEPLHLDGPGPKHLTPALRDRWRKSLESWEAPGPVRAALDRLTGPETAVVVTGQQPGVWGGPLYCVYKAATAVETARRITAETGRPAVAVFWINADDTDWDEVGWGTLPRPDLELYRTRWKSSPLGSRRWVGGARLSLPEGAAEVFEAWGAHGPLLGAPYAREPAELGTSFARCLLAWFGSEGLLPLDARWPEVRAAGADLWAAYVPRHAAIARAVTEVGESLRAEGTPVPLDAGAADCGLFPLEDDHRMDVDPDVWETEVRARLEAGRVETVAPSVLLRAPLQDHLFGPVTHVVGRGEAAYLRQLVPVYEALSIRRPVRLPRLHATLVPEGLLPLDRVGEVLADPEAWLAERARERVPQRAREAVADARGAVAERLRDLTEASVEFQKDLGQLAESARRKIDAQLARLEDSLDRRARQDLYREEPALRALPEFLRPRREDQDRGLSAAALALAWGEAAPSRVRAAARAHLDRLAEGALHHFVLEGPRV
jgi:uncharacterized protein YllA (UPF0747 family)